MDTNDLPGVDVPAGQAGTASREDPVEGRPETEPPNTPASGGPASSQDAVEGEPGPDGS
jgi:hypothetical protein